MQRKLAEVDLLRIRLACANVQIAELEKQVVIERLCVQYQIDPKKEAIDVGTGEITVKEAACGV